MLEIVRKPNTIYTTNGSVINQTGLTREIWDYYWTSYSRVTDGAYVNPLANNEYLDVYKQQRPKSIYDPCPYGFRLPVNGTHNMFKFNKGWKQYNYTGGAKFSFESVSTWLLCVGRRTPINGQFVYSGYSSAYWSSIIAGDKMCYTSKIENNKFFINDNGWVTSYANSLRCIEDL